MIARGVGVRRAGRRAPAATGPHVALLRGINNIGASRRVPMADLRDLFRGLGFRDVSTWLNSGNVVFSAPGGGRGDVRARIEEGLAAEYGLAARVIVLGGDEVVAAVRDNPLAGIATNPSHCLFMIPRARPDRRRLRPLLEERWAPEVLALGSRVAYLWCANGVARSPLWAAVDRALGGTATARNLATMTKLARMVEGATIR